MAVEGAKIFKTNKNLNTFCVEVCMENLYF